MEHYLSSLTALNLCPRMRETVLEYIKRITTSGRFMARLGNLGSAAFESKMTARSPSHDRGARSLIRRAD